MPTNQNPARKISPGLAGPQRNPSGSYSCKTHKKTGRPFTKPQQKTGTFTLLHRRLPPSLHTGISSPSWEPRPSSLKVSTAAGSETTDEINKLPREGDDDGTRPPPTSGACGKAARPGPRLPGNNKGRRAPSGLRQAGLRRGPRGEKETHTK